MFEFGFPRSGKPRSQWHIPIANSANEYVVVEIRGPQSKRARVGVRDPGHEVRYRRCRADHQVQIRAGQGGLILRFRLRAPLAPLGLAWMVHQPGAVFRRGYTGWLAWLLLAATLGFMLVSGWRAPH